ncbi:MAG TPA: hypothetical protein VGR77_03735 [Candidatus Dormibacteraeota bacterium]|nr:hypothetical protein [Candidatus Dormibacteraeota bacterium]
MDQDSQPPVVEPVAPPAGDALAVLRRPVIRALLALSLAAGAGIGGFVMANAATSPAASPSTSPAPAHTNCPNM